MRIGRIAAPLQIGRLGRPGLAGVAGGAEPLADEPGVGLQRFGPGPARAGHPADGDRPGYGRARFYQRFKWSVIAPIEADRWALDIGDVLGWLESAAGPDDVVRLAVETMSSRRPLGARTCRLPRPDCGADVLARADVRRPFNALWIRRMERRPLRFIAGRISLIELAERRRGRGTGRRAARRGVIETPGPGPGPGPGLRRLGTFRWGSGPQIVRKLHRFSVRAVRFWLNRRPCTHRSYVVQGLYRSDW